jgi:hypothetical protein
MPSRTARAVAVGLGLLAARGAIAQEQPATPLTRAQAAARANAASALGRAWRERNLPTAGRLIIPVLNGCVPEGSDEDITAFSIYVRLTQKGRVREVVTDLDPSLGRCLTSGAKDLQLPQPPRDDYWIQLNLAAPL